MKTKPDLKLILKDERGFSLPELLVTMLMMLTVMFALYSIFDMSLRVFSYGNDKTEAVQNARLGLEKMEREIRAAYPDSETEPTLLTDWESDRISFINYLGDSGTTSCPTPGGDCSQISYEVYTSDGEQALGRAVGPGDTANNEPVAENVDVSGDGQALTFEYFEDDGTPVVPGTDDESDIALVRVTLEIAVDNRTQALKTDVHLRNRSIENG